MLLADLGADVIRIEEPGGGQRARRERQATRLSASEERRQEAYRPLGRNKRSLILNLKHEAALRIFYQLVETADVVVEGYRPGVVKRLKVDYDTLRQINARLVYCSISGYGQDGPYRHLVGHDINYIAMAGALGIIGHRDTGSRPAIPSNLLADYAGGGLHAAFGILAALLARQHTGRGQFVDISMTDGVLGLLAVEAAQYFATGVPPRPASTRLNGAVPFYNVYETKDEKYIAVGNNEPWFYENMCRVLGCEEYLACQYDTDKYPEMFARFAERFRTKTRDQWFELMQRAEVCVAPVYGLEELEHDPQLRHRQMIVAVDHPELGPVKQIGISVKLSDTPGTVRHTAVSRGAHTTEILTTLGYTDETIRQLHTDGAIA
jgi:crotonobetainyl-CoA:carnitine CoA-transferase CaiB-like acyl-CoA transferase